MSFSFDANLVEDFLIPEGRYNFIISDVKERQSKNGHFMLCFEFTISEGEHEGRKTFESFLIDHPTAGNFAKRSLKQLSIACLLSKWADAAELKGKYFSANISHKEDNQGTLKERIVKFKKIQEQPLNFNALNTQDIPF